MTYRNNCFSTRIARGKRLALTMLLLAATLSTVSAQNTNTTNGQPPRPFWIFAHNPNQLSNVDDAVINGANALEPDIMLFPNSTCPTFPGPPALYVYHDATCPLRDLDTVETYLDHVYTKVKQGYNIALIAFDIKSPAANPDRVKSLYDAVRTHLNKDGVLVNILYSVGSFSDEGNGATGSCSGVFCQISSILGDNEGVQIDGENDPVKVYTTLPGPRKGFGNGSFGITSGFAPNVVPSIMEASWFRASQIKSGFAIPYAFPIPITLDSIDYLWYDLIIFGVDGLIADNDEQPQIWIDTVNNISRLSDKLASATPGSSLADVYVATAADNPFQARKGYGLRIDTADIALAGTTANLTFTLTGTCGSAKVTVNSDYQKLFGRGDRNYVTIFSKPLGRLTSLYLSSTSTNIWRPTHIQISSAAFGIPYADDKELDFGASEVSSNYAQFMKIPDGWGYDCTPPTATPTASPAANGAGWNNSDVTVTWNWADTSGAGLDTTGTSCPASSTSSGEGSLPLSATCTDNAGNTFKATHQVKVDKTAPVVQCGTADGLWHASDISIACTASDALSGLALAANANFRLSTSVPALTETNNAFTSQQPVVDVAGNSSTAGPIGGNKIDKKPPVITIVQPAATTYTHSSTLTLNYTVTDGGSGVATVSPTMNGNTTVAGLGLSSGQAIPLLTALALGPNTFTINSTDNVGNHSSQSITFSIIVTAQSIIDDVNQFVASGAVDPRGSSLLAMLNNALPKQTAGQCSAAGNIYGAFINEVQAQTGKSITPVAAAILRADAQYLQTHCP